MGVKRGTTTSGRKAAHRGQKASPFDGFIEETQRRLVPLETDLGFTSGVVDIHPPECTVTYKRDDLWVQITYEYPGVPFCTLRIKREDGKLARIGFDVVAERVGLPKWKSPHRPVGFAEAAAAVRENAAAVFKVLNALARVDAKELFRDQLWRQYS